MVKGKNAKELVGLAHTNMLTALGNADPNDVNLCYGIMNNLFQILRLEDFYTELEQIQGGEVQKPQEYEPCNVTAFPQQTEAEPSEACPEVDETTQDEPTVTCTHTMEEVRDLLTKAAKAGKNIKPLLAKYGASKLSDLDASVYDEAYEDALALLGGD